MKTQYTLDYIQGYLKGQLSKEEMYALEKEALTNPFLADTIAGYELALKKAGTARVQESLATIQKQPISNHIDSFKKKKNLFALIGIVIVLLILGIIGWNNFNFDQKLVLAPEPEENKPVTGVPMHDLLVEDYEVEILLKDGSGKPMPQQDIVIYNQSFRTDKNGNIQVRPLKTGTNFTVDIAGYVPYQVYIPKDYRDKVEIQLNPIDHKRESIQVSKDRLYAPEGGWFKFQSYVETNKVLPANNLFLKGSVIISAKLSSNHTLSELEIVQSINKEYDNEAIRLIKNYNAWKNKMSAPIVIYLEVVF